MSIVAEFERNSNYGIALADTMEGSVRELVTHHMCLAEGIQELCEAQIKDPSPQLLDYALRGAAVMRAAYTEAHEFWLFEDDATK